MYKLQLLIILLLLFFNSAIASNWSNTAPVGSQEMLAEKTSASKSNFNSKDRSTFSRLYKKHKRPKFIILFNKELSGDVNDWRENTRLVISDDTRISLQQKNNDSGQINFPPQWVWQFEQGFFNIFESLRVRLIDINTAKRLTASAQIDNSSGLSGMVNSLKKNEMDALSGYAKYYIELVIIRSPKSDFGYLLKARMIETKTGEIIARVNSLSWNKKTGVYRASKHGYSEKSNSFVANNDKPYEASKHGYMPENNIEIDIVASYLAKQLIKKINQAWSY